MKKSLALLSIFLISSLPLSSFSTVIVPGSLQVDPDNWDDIANFYSNIAESEQLFSTSEAWADDLDSGMVPTALVNEFKNNIDDVFAAGVASTEVAVEVSSRQWLVLFFTNGIPNPEGNASWGYTIKHENNALNVYDAMTNSHNGVALTTRVFSTEQAGIDEYVYTQTLSTRERSNNDSLVDFLTPDRTAKGQFRGYSYGQGDLQLDGAKGAETPLAELLWYYSMSTDPDPSEHDRNIDYPLLDVDGEWATFFYTSQSEPMIRDYILTTRGSMRGVAGWATIPEPPSLSLFCSGLLALLCMRRNRPHALSCSRLAY